MHKAMMSSREVRCSARWRLTTRSRPFIASGGLVSYGDNPLDSYRLTGAYGPHPQGRLELFIKATAARTGAIRLRRCMSPVLA